MTHYLPTKFRCPQPPAKKNISFAICSVGNARDNRGPRVCRRTSCATTRTAKKNSIASSQHAPAEISTLSRPSDQSKKHVPAMSCGVHHPRARPLSHAALRCRPHFAREQHKQDVMLATFLGTPPRFLGQHSKNLAMLTFPAYALAFLCPKRFWPSQTAPTLYHFALGFVKSRAETSIVLMADKAGMSKHTLAIIFRVDT